MTLTSFLWFLGGWFALSVVVSLVMARMMCNSSVLDASNSAEEPAVTETPADEVNRPRVAA
jgi:hypothetical protein